MSEWWVSGVVSEWVDLSGEWVSWVSGENSGEWVSEWVSVEWVVSGWWWVSEWEWVSESVSECESDIGVSGVVDEWVSDEWWSEWVVE